MADGSWWPRVLSRSTPGQNLNKVIHCLYQLLIATEVKRARETHNTNANSVRRRPPLLVEGPCPVPPMETTPREQGPTPHISL